MKMPIFTGAAVAIITPMLPDGSVDYKGLADLVEFQIKGGTDAIVICGTTGESATLKDDEHLECIRVAVETAAGRIPVIAGTGSNYTEHAVEMSKEAKARGADALLLVTPYYNKTTQRGLVASFNTIVDAAGLPAILYNVPSRTGVNIESATAKELAKNPLICGIKEASGNISQIAMTAALCGDELPLYSGNDDQVVPILALGGKGVISVFSNALPGTMHQLTAAMLQGDLATARKLNVEYLELMDGFFMDVNPIPIKEALYQMGLMQTNYCRMPLTTMTETGREKLAALLKKHSLI